MFLTSVKTFLLIFLTFMYAFFISKDTSFQSVATNYTFPFLGETVILFRQLTTLNSEIFLNFIQQCLIIILIRLQICIYKKLE